MNKPASPVPAGQDAFAPKPAAAAQTAAPGRFRYRVLALIFIVTVINYADRATMSIAGTSVVRDLGLDPVKLGMIFSAFAWAYALGQVPGGWLLDRFGARRVYGCSLVLWSLFTMLQGTVGWMGLSGLAAASALFAMRFMLGLVESPAFPANSRIVACWFPTRERGTASALFNSAQYMAVVVFAPLMGWLTHSMGWEHVFLWMGALGLGLSVVWFAFYREPHSQKRLSSAELDVKAEIHLLEQASIRDARDKKNLQLAMDESVSRAGRVLLRKNGLAQRIEAMQLNEKTLITTQSRTRLAKRTAELEANKWPALLEELARWESSSGSAQAQADIEASRAQSIQVEQDLGRVQTQLAVLQQNKSDREKSLASITDGLTQQLFPDGAFGTFDPRDEQRPFRLSMRGGEAFRVLEVLLGDIACMLDSPRMEGALPGLFIHDCPREADMSTGLYENFLSLIDTLQKEQYPDGQLPFQYIVTTTTPPPLDLQGDVVRLTLDPSSDEGLLFRRRFIAERQEALR